MDKFEKKSLKTSRGFTYTYYTSPQVQRVDEGLPTLFLVHGFPDDSQEYKFIVPHLLKLPYRILIPDCLGYSDSSKPLDAAAYSHEGQTQDFMEIFDKEGIDKVISIGHDWGSMVANRVYVYHPERVAGLILLNVGYIPPATEPFDLDATNELTTQYFGYPIYSYWELFTSPDGAKVIEDNAERAWEVLHGADDEWMKKMFCVKDAMRKYLEDHQSYTVELKPYAKDPVFRQTWIDRVRRDGLAGPLNYYNAHRNNIQYEAEKKLPEGRNVLKVPVLFIGCTQDAVCRPDGNTQPKADGLMPDLEEVVLESGHWSPFEIPDQMADAMIKWLSKRFPFEA